MSVQNLVVLAIAALLMTVLAAAYQHNTQPQREPLIGSSQEPLIGSEPSDAPQQVPPDQQAQQPQQQPPEQEPLVQAQTAPRTQSTQNVDLRLLHTAPDAPAIDVYVDGEQVLNNVRYRQTTDYQTVPAGSQQVTVTAADTGETILQQTLSLSSGRHTVVAGGELEDNSFQLFPYRDLETCQFNGAAVSFGHFSPDAPVVDITTANGDVLFDNIDLGQTTPYVAFPADRYRLQIRQATQTNDGPVLAEETIRVRDRRGYSLYATGYVQSENEPSQRGFTIERTRDGVCEEGAAAPEPNTGFRLRIG